MLHIGDRIEKLSEQHDYVVSAIYAGHAVADRISDNTVQVSVSFDPKTLELVFPDLYKLVDCPHEPATPKSSPRDTRRSENAVYNLGVLDGTLRELSWVLRNMVINCGAMSETQLYRKANDALMQIHHAYNMLKPTIAGDVPGGMLSQKKLPPVA